MPRASREKHSGPEREAPRNETERPQDKGPRANPRSRNPDGTRMSVFDRLKAERSRKQQEKVQDQPAPNKPPRTPRRNRRAPGPRTTSVYNGRPDRAKPPMKEVRPVARPVERAPVVEQPVVDEADTDQEERDAARLSELDRQMAEERGRHTELVRRIRADNGAGKDYAGSPDRLSLDAVERRMANIKSDIDNLTGTAA